MNKLINEYQYLSSTKLKFISKIASIEENLDKDIFIHPYVNMDEERDAPFLIINNELLIGNFNQIHSDLQIKYMQEHNEEIKYAIYGHIINDTAIIDYIEDDYNALDEAKTIALLKNKFNKVYNMSGNNGEFIFNRLAKGMV